MPNVVLQSGDWLNILISRWNGHMSHITCPVNPDEPETATQSYARSLRLRHLSFSFVSFAVNQTQGRKNRRCGRAKRPRNIPRGSCFLIFFFFFTIVSCSKTIRNGFWLFRVISRASEGVDARTNCDWCNFEWFSLATLFR